jgi:hypothetical protein
MPMSDLREIIDLHDRLVAACVGVAPDDAVEAAAEVGRAARRRVGYLGDTVLVALAGGTGAGKSSLLNALAGEEVSAPGAMRPTTAEPVAWIPSNPEPGLTRLLDDIGVHTRIGQERHPWLAVVDLPDLDSVVMDHRLRVERLLPLVDSVVWVVDPEKYQDARLHRDHLAPLAGHADRFVFALNQVDRVGARNAGILAADFRRSLQEDGIAEPVIVLTAGDPSDGLHRGLDELLTAIRGLGSTAEVVARRVVDELVASADRLVAPLGGAAGTGFVAQWTGVRNEVAARIAGAVEIDLRRRAREVASADARAVTAWLGSRPPSAVITASGAHLATGGAQPVLGLVERVSGALDPGSRMALFDTARTIEDEVAAVARSVGATTTVPLDDPPAWWSKVRVLSYMCAIAVVLGVALVVDAWRSNDGIFVGMAVVAGGAGGLSGLRMLVRRSTQSRVESALANWRDETSSRVTAELERRVGRPLRAVLRARSAPGAAHTELMLAVDRYEERQD